MQNDIDVYHAVQSLDPPSIFVAMLAVCVFSLFCDLKQTLPSPHCSDAGRDAFCKSQPPVSGAAEDLSFCRLQDASSEAYFEWCTVWTVYDELR